MWKPGPTSPATVAAWPRGEWFRMRIFLVAGGADPGRGAERLVGGEPAANQSVRIGDLRDVARGPSVETGADVPSYSGGLAAW